MRSAHEEGNRVYTEIVLRTAPYAGAILFGVLFATAPYGLIPSWILYLAVGGFVTLSAILLGSAVNRILLGARGCRRGYLKDFTFGTVILGFVVVSCVILDGPFFLFRFYFGVQTTGADAGIVVIRKLLGLVVSCYD